MILFGFDLSLSTIIHSCITLLLILFILIREYLWYSSYNLQKHSIKQLNEDKDNLLLRIEMEKLAQYECSNDINLLNDTNLYTHLANQSFHIRSNNILLQPLDQNIYLRDQIYFDMVGFMQIVLCCSLVYIEFCHIHKPHLELASSESSTEISIRRRLYDFLLKKYPITNIFVHISIIILSSLAWCGWMNRDEIVHISLKMYLSLLLSGPICFIIHNFIRIKNYFPQDLDTWKKSLTEIRWYIWLFSRLIGAYDIPSVTNTILWLGSLILIMWPIRYIFYYRHQSCSIIETNHIFFVNMIGHSSVLIVCVYVLYIMAIMKSSYNLPHIVSPNDSHTNPISSKDTKTQKNIDVIQGMGLDTDKYSYFGKILQYLDNANSIAIFSLFAILNSLCMLFRITWFAWISTTGCTWYAWSICWLFLYIHIGIIIYALPSVNVLMQKYQTIETYKSGFLHFERMQKKKQKFDKDNNDINSKDKDNNDVNNDHTNNDTKNDGKDENMHLIFNKILTDAMLYHLFVSTTVHTSNQSSSSRTNNNNNSETSGKESTDGEPDCKLSTIFLAMMQTAIYNAEQSASQEQNDENQS